jgi:hypothetical protein
LKFQLHFEDTEFEQHRADGWRKLKNNAVPTLLSMTSPRQMRNLKRPSTEFYEQPTATQDYHQYSKRPHVGEKKVVSAVQSEEQIVPDLESQEDQEINNEKIAEPSMDDQPFDPIDKLKKKLKHVLRKLRMERERSKILAKNLERFLNEDQIKRLSCKNKSRGTRWSSQTVGKALKIRFASGTSGYAHLIREGYPLPSYRTLCERVQNARFDEGIHRDVLEWLRIKVNSQSGFGNCDCVLAFDEMQLRPTIEYDNGKLLLSINLYTGINLF